MISRAVFPWKGAGDLIRGGERQVARMHAMIEEVVHLH